MNTPSGAEHPAEASWLGRLQLASFTQAGEVTRKAYPPERQMTDAQMERYLARRTYALASTTRRDGRAHAAPTLFSLHAEAFWLPTLGGAVRVDNVRSHPWLALSVLEGEHDTHAAILAEGPAEVLVTVPREVRTITGLRNRGGNLDWATAWLRMTPQRLFHRGPFGQPPLPRPIQRPTPSLTWLIAVSHGSALRCRDAHGAPEMLRLCPPFRRRSLQMSSICQPVPSSRRTSTSTVMSSIAASTG
jgi:Pyridoxamine 5'-phosphate oxidase